VLVEQLGRHIIRNTKPTQKDVVNLSFLCESFVLELLHAGYSSKYISNLPDILLLRNGWDEFPFEKTALDFPDDKLAYEQYVKESGENMKLIHILQAFGTLLKRPMKRGHVVFKVEGLELDSDQIHHAGTAQYYNPKRRSILNTEHVVNDDRRTQLLAAEKFLYEKSTVDANTSGCNMVVPAHFRQSSEMLRTKDFLEALGLAEASLELILSNVTWKLQRDQRIATTGRYSTTLHSL
jgi:hypothetical protein